MENSTKIKIGVVLSAAAAVACTYISIKRRKIQDAVKSLNYMTINTVSDEISCHEVISELIRRCEIQRAVGFDCEWVMEQGKRCPVALLQLSTLDGYCGLFRLSHMKSIPESLKNFLENPRIYKVGVAPADDAKYLFQDYGLYIQSTLDIRYISEISGHKPGGLATMSKNLLGIVLDKSWRIRCSDWEAQDLTPRQLNYAAADAHVAIKIFEKLLNELASRTWLKWLWISDSDKTWENIDKICEKYLDLSYKSKNCESNPQKQGCKKEAKVSSKRYPHATRKSPLYHNCFLEAPDGELLCTIDTKKAQWYVEKGLADTISPDPLTVRLRFEPSGRSVGDVGRYYQQSKENKCVVCGSDDSYIRKNVVPREYRKYFPEIMKEHSSHDVVLLCATCHKSSNMRDGAVRAALAQRCLAPVSCAGVNNKYLEDADCRRIRSAARALLNSSKRGNLPHKRRDELEQVLVEYYPQREITEELLQQAASLQVIYENSEYECHGAKVVEHFTQNGGLLRLEEIWRQHFLDAMQPRHLPPLWSVKHNEERLRIKFEEGRLSKEDMELVGITNWI